VAAVLFVIGVFTMYLSWGVWGVFVTCSALTLVVPSAPAFALLPRSRARLVLLGRMMSCALWFMTIGWGLVALLNPEYTIGWLIPGKGGGSIEITGESSAHLAGVTLLSLGVLAVVLTLVVGIRVYLGEARREHRRPVFSNPRSGNPAVRDRDRRLPVRDRLR
jgi:hypothetical protein